MPADAAGEEDGGAGAALGQMGLWVERQGARGALRLQPERQGAAWCNQTTGELEASARSDLQARATAPPPPPQPTQPPTPCTRPLMLCVLASALVGTALSSATIVSGPAFSLVLSWLLSVTARLPRPRNKRTRLVLPPVLSGHVSSFPP